MATLTPIDPRTTASEPGRRTVADFTDYRDAEAAVDRLTAQRFPAEHVAIVGAGLTLVEQVSGRGSARRAAGRGALSGALVGALVGWFMGLVNWFDPLVSALTLAFYGLLVGAAFGAVVGLVARELTGRGQGAAVPKLRAERFEMVVDAEWADQAAELLRGPRAGRFSR